MLKEDTSYLWLTANSSRKWRRLSWVALNIPACLDKDGEKRTGSSDSSVGSSPPAGSLEDRARGIQDSQSTSSDSWEALHSSQSKSSTLSHSVVLMLLASCYFSKHAVLQRNSELQDGPAGPSFRSENINEKLVWLVGLANSSYRNVHARLANEWLSKLHVRKRRADDLACNSQ